MSEQIGPGTAAPAGVVWEIEFLSPVSIGTDRGEGKWPRSEWREEPDGGGSRRPMPRHLETRIPGRTLRGAAAWWWDVLGTHSAAFRSNFGGRMPGTLPAAVAVGDGLLTRWDDAARARTWSFNRFDRAARRAAGVHCTEAAGLAATYQAAVTIGGGVGDAERKGVVLAMLAVRAIGADRTSGFGRCRSRLFAGAAPADPLRPQRSVAWKWETDYGGQVPAELYCVHHLLRHPDPVEALAMVRRHVEHKRRVEGARRAQSLWGREGAEESRPVTISALGGSPFEFRNRPLSDVLLDWTRSERRDGLDPAVRSPADARAALLDLVAHVKVGGGRRRDGG